MRTALLTGALLMILSSPVAIASAAPLLGDEAPGFPVFVTGVDGLCDAIAAGAQRDRSGGGDYLAGDMISADLVQAASVSLTSDPPVVEATQMPPGSILGPASVAMFGIGLLSLLSLYRPAHRR